MNIANENINTLCAGGTKNLVKRQIFQNKNWNFY